MKAGRAKKLFERKLGAGEEGTRYVVAEVSYDEGGLNVWNGRSIPRGYTVYVHTEERTETMVMVRIGLAGRGDYGKSVLLGEAKRFSEKALAGWAESAEAREVAERLVQEALAYEASRATSA